MIQTNKYIGSLKPSATLAINEQVKTLVKEGKEIYHFGFGQSPFPIQDSIVKALEKNASVNHYLPTIGLEELRQAIANFLRKHQNIEANSSFIYIGPGSKELLYQTILILGGVFLIPKGSWVSYGPQIKSKNGTYEILSTSLEDNFKLTPDTLTRYCDNHPDQQKTLILNSPNNPTGAVYSEEELKNIAKVCRTNNIIVLSDEIYSQINFTDDCSPSISKYYPEKTMVFGGLSKVFSAGGYRLGFMTVPDNLRFMHDMYHSVFSETFSSVAAPIQYAAVEAYNMNNEIVEYVHCSKLILKEISHYIYMELVNVNIQCSRPQGAFYVIIGFNFFKNKINSIGISTSEQLADHLLQNYNVALLPGTDFYFNQNDLFLRLAFVDFNGREVMDQFLRSTEIDKEFIRRYCPKLFEGVNKLIEFVSDL